MFIQTEDTPNPTTMKFLPSRAVASRPVEIVDESQASISPLAQALFTIKGVKSVFLGADFISVTRSDDAPEWPSLRPAVLAVIMEHFVAERPVLVGDAAGEKGACACGVDCSRDSCSGTPQCADADKEVVRQINELLNLRIRPAVAQDGGDVAFERYEDGIVFLRLKGACSGCPSATATLKFGIEQMLRHFIPEVKEVRRVM